MGKLKATITTVFKNKVILFIFSRYGTYVIHFINSIFIAVYLGPYYLGIWGFITLVTQYMNHLNFGISNAVTAITSVNKDKEVYVQKVVGTAMSMLLGLSLIAILLFTINEVFNLDLGSKYDFSTYAPVVVFIGILGYFNTLFNNVFRVYGKLFEIAFSQTIFPLFMLAAVIFFRDSSLLWALVIANFSAFLISFLLYLFRLPIKAKPILNYNLFKKIKRRGWHLFIYNTSFYFIIISTRSFIGGYYTVEEFGYFTFAFTLANVMLLLLQSFSYLIYPKILNRFANSEEKQNTRMLEKLRNAYVTTSHLLIHLAILFFPFFLLFFPQYDMATEAFKLIALSIVLYTNSFGYSGLLVAKGYEKKLGRVAFSALAVNVIVALILIKLLNVPFTLVILSTMFSYFVYVFVLGYMGRKMLKLDVSIISILSDINPLRLFFPHVLSLCLIIFSISDIYFVIPPILFLILNFKVLLSLEKTIKSIILNPNVINI